MEVGLVAAFLAATASLSDILVRAFAEAAAFLEAFAGFCSTGSSAISFFAEAFFLAAGFFAGADFFPAGFFTAVFVVVAISTSWLKLNRTSGLLPDDAKT